MFKIQVYFKSNIKGVYTKEEETATDKFQLVSKKQRMIDRWFHILCCHIDIGKYEHCILEAYRLTKNEKFDYCEEINKLKIDLINQTLENLNKFDELITGETTTEETKRYFKITVEEF